MTWLLDRAAWQHILNFLNFLNFFHLRFRLEKTSHVDFTSKPLVSGGPRLAIAIAVELGLGLLLLVGFQTRWAALGIAFFTFVITFIFHPLSDPAQVQAFFKNMAVVGGLLTVAAWGAGAWSVDAKRGR